MLATWTMALRNLQRRLLQSVVVGTILALSALLFFAGLGLFAELRGPFERMFEEQNGSHLTLHFDTRSHPPEEVLGWWKKRPEVVSMSPLVPRIELEGSSYHEQEQLNSLLYVAERPNEPTTQDLLKAVAGSLEGGPGPGEIWIPTSVANEGGIEVGETLEIPTYQGLQSFDVTAVVVDPQHSAPFNNPKRLWVAPGELPLHFALAELSEVQFGVRLTDAALCQPLWIEFKEAMGGAFAGGNIDYQGMILGYTAPYSAMAAMLVAFSVLSVLISLFATHGTLTSALLADFRVLGLLRAQGFTPSQVRDVYLLQYLALVLVAAPIGVAVGFPLVRQGVNLLMSSTGAAVSGSSLWGLAVVTVLLFVALVWAFVWLVARRAARVRPADAIRVGALVAGGGDRQWPQLEKVMGLGLPLAVAVKSLGTQRRRALLLVASVAFATLAASLAVNLDHSFRRGQDDPSILGFDDADVRIVRGGRRFGMRHDTMVGVLRDHPDVAHVATSDFYEAEVLAGDGPTRDLLGTVLSGDVDALRIRHLEGRSPETDSEVSVGANTLRDLGLEIGDSMRLFIQGFEVELEIVGVFQTLNNGGTGFRILLDGVRRAEPFYEPVQYGVVLREGVDSDAFIDSLEAEYGEAVDGQPGDLFLRRIMATVLTGMRFSNGFLTGVFLLAAAVLIFNATLMQIAEGRATFGVLKTVGMTPRQLRVSIVAGVAILAVSGITVGLVLWAAGAPAFLSALFASLGLVSFPLATDVVGTALAVLVIFVFCVAAAWLPSARVLDIDPRSLIVE